MTFPDFASPHFRTPHAFGDDHRRSRRLCVALRGGGGAVKVLVCGGRDFSDEAAVARALDALKPTEVIHGAAAGADALAGAWARANGVPELRFPADWKSHGRAAGPIRNGRMLAEGRPDLVVAFPGWRGTADMLRRAVAAGVPVRIVTEAAR